MTLNAAVRRPPSPTAAVSTPELAPPVWAPPRRVCRARPSAPRRWLSRSLSGHGGSFVAAAARSRMPGLSGGLSRGSRGADGTVTMAIPG